MAKRQAPFQWEKYFDAQMRAQYDDEIVKAIENMTPTDLYEQSMRTGTARYLVDRPVTYALHGTETNYQVKPMEIMRNCLRDGQVVLRIGDPEHIRIELYVVETEYDDKDRIIFVARQWQVENPKDKDKKLWHREEYKKEFDDHGNPIAKLTIFNNPESESDLEPMQTVWLPFWPYVGITWVDKESIIEPVMNAVIRQEGVTVQIGSENVRHGGRKLFIVGMKGEDNRLDPRSTIDRINYLPPEAEAYYVDSDSSSLSMMFEEAEKLDYFIERTTGVISIRQLANLSGESREIAERPLVQLAWEIRARFDTGMEEVVEILQAFFGLSNTVTGDSPDYNVIHQFLKIITDKGKHAKILEIAVAKGAVTKEEEIQDYRRLLELPNKDPKELLLDFMKRETRAITSEGVKEGEIDVI